MTLEEREVSSLEQQFDGRMENWNWGRRIFSRPRAGWKRKRNRTEEDEAIRLFVLLIL
uniref:Uncharacterized protein n=1 Tax=Arundo donax TaxID=35708 RepID=A0A0A9GUB3_ARUDO